MKTFPLILLISVILAVSFAGRTATNSESNSEEEDRRRAEKTWKKEPEFLDEMSSEAKESFREIKFDRDITRAQKTKDLLSWADKYDVEDEMAKFLDERKADRAQKKLARKVNYKRLAEIIASADVILDDEENSKQAAEDKLKALVKDEEREVVDAFRAFYPFVKCDKRKEGRRHHHQHHRGRHGNRAVRHLEAELEERNDVNDF